MLGSLSKELVYGKFMDWISVKDRLPEKTSFVFVYIPNSGIWGAFYRYWDDDPPGKWYFPNYDCDIFTWDDDDIVTHWMPRPQPPKDE